MVRISINDGVVNVDAGLLEMRAPMLAAACNCSDDGQVHSFDTRPTAAFAAVVKYVQSGLIAPEHLYDYVSEFHHWGCAPLATQPDPSLPSLREQAKEFLSRILPQGHNGRNTLVALQVSLPWPDETDSSDFVHDCIYFTQHHLPLLQMVAFTEFGMSISVSALAVPVPAPSRPNLDVDVYYLIHGGVPLFNTYIPVSFPGYRFDTYGFSHNMPRQKKTVYDEWQVLATISMAEFRSHFEQPGPAQTITMYHDEVVTITAKGADSLVDIISSGAHVDKDRLLLLTWRPPHAATQCDYFNDEPMLGDEQEIASRVTEMQKYLHYKSPRATERLIRVVCMDIRFRTNDVLQIVRAPASITAIAYKKSEEKDKKIDIVTLLARKVV